MPLEAFCSVCKGRFKATELLDITDEQYCSECFGKTFAQCSSCKEVVERKDSESWNGKDWCHTCLTNKIAVCDGCKEQFYKSNLESVGDEFYCEVCFNDKFTQCESCNETIWREDAGYWNNENWCQDCLDDRTFICEDCGYRFARESEEHIGNDNYLYCSECIDTHRCDEVEVPEHTIPFAKTASQTFNSSRYKNFCGVEIECLNDNLKNECFTYDELKQHGFSQIYDGSLDNRTGVEFVSNPFNGDLLLKKIDEFCEELAKRKYYIDKSCGLHIHIGVPNRIRLLKKVFVFYRKYEGYFFDMLPKSRRENCFCQSINSSCHHITADIIANCGSSADFQKLFYEVKSIKRIKSLKKYKYHQKRYTWLNFHSLFYRGTLEFRSHAGTIDAEKINNWLLMHLTILDFLRRIPFPVVCELPVTKEFFLSLFNGTLQKYITARWQRFNSNPLEVEC